MDRKAIFQKVKTHLLTQKRKSMDPADAFCSYRGTENRSCAIGCLIPDSIYDPDIERLTVIHAKVSKDFERFQVAFLCEGDNDVLWNRARILECMCFEGHGPPFCPKCGCPKDLPTNGETPK